MGDTLRILTTEYMLRRIRGEYLEMPGLRLTRRQAQRLWGLDQNTCAQLLDALTDAKFLRRSEASFLHQAEGEVYARLTEGAVAASSVRMAGRVDRNATARASQEVADEMDSALRGCDARLLIQLATLSLRSHVKNRRCEWYAGCAGY